MRFCLLAPREQDRQELPPLLRRRFAALCADIALDVFPSAGELLAAWEPGKYAVLLLDADAEGMKELQTARRLRKLDPACQFIFFSDSAAQALRSFPLHPVDFLLRPLRYETLAAALDCCRTSWQAALRRVEVRVQHVPVRIALCDLYSAEVSSRVTRLRGRQGTVDAGISMAELERRLGGLPFLRCHKSFCVNLFAVRELGPEAFLLADGTEVPISRDRRREVEEAYEAFVESWKRL